LSLAQLKDITAQLECENACYCQISLLAEGKKHFVTDEQETFFDGLKFHRVIPNFIKEVILQEVVLPVPAILSKMIY
jgi:cyclophilin family peptidyl-prolyl cis-trans isomerase